MESAAQNSGAVENPKKNVPLACLFGTLGAAVIYILSTTVIQGIVPNADLANAHAPFAYVYAQMFDPTIGKIIMALAVIACVGSLLGWQFTISQVARTSASQRMFPQFFAKVNKHNAPVIGLVTGAALQSLAAMSTMSPDATAQFNKLINLTAVTILIPYVTAISALMVVMYKAGADVSTRNRNLVFVMISVLYSVFAIYASGAEAVLGAMIVMMAGYLLYGFIAYRFVGPQSAPRAAAAAAED
jgi:putrescine:ornithine antiporter